MDRRPGVSDAAARPTAALRRGSLLNLLGAGSTALSTLGLVLVTARVLAPSDAGRVFAVTSGFLLVAAALRAGAPTGVVLFIARREPASGDAHRIARMALAPALIASGIVCVVGAPAAALLGRAAGLGDEPAARATVLMLLACLPCAVALDIVLAVSRGQHDMRPTVLIDRIGRPVLQVGLTAAVAAAPSVLTLTAAWALPYVAALAVAVGATPTLRERPVAAPVPAPGERREFTRFVVARGCTVLMQAAFARLDILLVVALAGPGEAALYTVATRFVSICQLVQQAIATAGEPTLARALGRGDRRTALQVYRTTTVWLVVLLWPALLLTGLLAHQWLGLFGAEYVDGRAVVVVLTAAMLLATGVGTAETILNMAGRTTVLLGTNALSLVAMVGLDLLLVPRYGATGAAIGWAIAIVLKNLLALTQAAVSLGGTPFGRRWARATGLALVTVGLPALLAMACASGGGPAGPGSAPPPDHPVLVGAAVPPVLPVTGAQTAAFERLDDSIGEHTAIAHLFRPWGAPLVPADLRALADEGRTPLLSWNAADIAGIAAGAHDEEIAAQARTLAESAVPVLLRFRWEMDRPNLRGTVGSAETYVAAWRRARTIFRVEGAGAVSWVWCPTAAGFGPGGDAATFYPGDQDVDWLCADAYPDRSLESLADLLHPFLNWAAGHDKPVMVGEFGVPRSAADDERARWLDAATSWLRTRSDIDAVVYFALDVVPGAPVLQFGLDPGSAAAAAFGRLVRDLDGEAAS